MVITNIDTYVDKLHTIWPSINLLNSWGVKWGNNGQFNINKDNYECFYASNQTPIIIRYIEIENFNSRRRKLFVNNYDMFIKELLLHAQNPVPSETKFEDAEEEKEEDDDDEEEVDDRITDMMFYAQYGTKLEKLEECAERGTTDDTVKEQVNQFFRLPVETKKEILDKNAVNFQNKSDLCGEGNHFNLNYNKYIGQTKGGKNKSKIKRNKTRRLKCKSTRKKCRRRKQRRTTRKSDINLYYANR